MPDPRDFELPLPVPRDEYLFEDMMLDLFRKHWGDRNAQRNGRRGQKQKGVDVYGQPSWLSGGYAGVQCKRYYLSNLTLAQVRQEINAAEKFRPELREYLIVTTNPRDANLQEAVRLINQAREEDDKFTVRIMFWEDIGDLLTDDANYDVLREYYKSWQQVFAPAGSTATEIIQLMRERAAFEASAATANENYFRVELARLRALVNGGYFEVGRPGVATLVEQLEAVQPAPSIPDELKGNIYRLAAHAFVSTQEGGDIKKARAYLRQARAFLTTPQGAAACEVTEAYLLYRAAMHGHFPGLPSASVSPNSPAELMAQARNLALAKLEGVEHPDAIRTRFVIYIEAGDLSACDQILSQMSAMSPAVAQDGSTVYGAPGTNNASSTATESALDTTDWLRPLVLYYAQVGDADRVRSIIEKMTASGTAADYSMAGQALSRLAYKAYSDFCEQHNILPETNSAISLQLGELIDRQMLLDAAELFERAGDAYVQHGCRIQAIEEVTAAIRVRTDNDETGVPDRLWRNLEKIDPNNPFLSGRLAGSQTSISSGPGAQPGGAAYVERIEGLLQDSTTSPSDVLMALELPSELPSEVEVARSLIRVLREHETAFTEEDSVHIRYLRILWNLHVRSGDDAITREWLEQIEPPARYVHVKHVLNLMYFIGRDDEQAARWLEQAEREYPSRPEVLEIMRHYFRYKHDVEGELRVSRQLFQIRACNASGTNLLDVLVASRRFNEALDFVAQYQDLPLNEEVVHRASSMAFMHHDRFLQAQPHLEQLRRAGVATFDDQMRLARAYHLAGQSAQAVSVLLDLVAQFPDEPAAYIALSTANLRGANDHERFRWAREGYRRFPDNEGVALNLVEAGFDTGNHMHPAVGDALRQFLPDGRFANSSAMRMVHWTEGLDMLEARQRWLQSLYRLYQQGTMPLMLLCHIQKEPLFRAHQQGVQFQQVRYAGIGAHTYDAADRVTIPQQVILDYSALLTLWSLYGEDWPVLLQEQFDRVWVSSKLQGIIAWEHDRLAQYGQPDRHRAKVSVRDAINTRDGQVHRLPQADPENGVDVVGEHTEGIAACERELPYVSEHHTSGVAKADQQAGLGYYAEDQGRALREESAAGSQSTSELDTSKTGTVLGLRTIVAAMTRHGRMTPAVRTRLLEHARPSNPEEAEWVERLTPGSGVVVALSTLETFALCGALANFFEYFGDIYISAPAWRSILEEIREFELLAEMAGGLAELQTQLREAIQRGIIQVGEANDVEQTIPPLAEVEDAGDEEPAEGRAQTTSGRDGVQIEIETNREYLNDLLALARNHHAPIWADDRWLLELPGNLAPYLRPPGTFGTDYFLRWRKSRTGDDTQYHESYERLIHWRYLGLPFNTEYLLTLVEQGYPIDAGPIMEAIQLYVSNVLQYSEAATPNDRWSGHLRESVYDSYGQGLATLLVRCHESKVDVQVTAALFRALDLTGYDPLWQGRQPHYYACIWAEVLAGRGLEEVIAHLDNRDQISRNGLSLLEWLEEIAREAGVSAEVVLAAKFDLLKQLAAQITS